MSLYNKQVNLRQASFVTGLNKKVILKGIKRGLISDDYDYYSGRHHINLGDLREFCLKLHNGAIQGVSPLIRLYPMATIDKFIMLFIYKVDYTNSDKLGGMILDREVLIGALLANGTPQKASEALGVSRSTVYKAMAESGFNEAYMQAKQELLQAISNKLSNSMLQSIITVEQIRDNEENSPQVRLNSCQIILTTGYRIREQAEIITRLEKLEKAEQERRLDNNE